MDIKKKSLLLGCLLLSACVVKRETQWGIGFVGEDGLPAQVMGMQIITDRHEFISMHTLVKIGQDGSRKLNVFHDAPAIITFCWRSERQSDPYATVITLTPDDIQQIRSMQSSLFRRQPTVLVSLRKDGYTKAWLTSSKVDPDAHLIHQGFSPQGKSLSFCSSL